MITLNTKLSRLNWNEDSLSLNHLADEAVLDRDHIGNVWGSMLEDATVRDYIHDLRRMDSE